MTSPRDELIAVFVGKMTSCGRGEPEAIADPLIANPVVVLRALIPDLEDLHERLAAIQRHMPLCLGEREAAS